MTRCDICRDILPSGSRGRPRRYCSETCARRAERRKAKRWGYRGPECLACGGVRTKVAESGYTADDQRIRRRICLDCGQDAASVEVFIDPALTTFWRLNPARQASKRANDIRHKGLYRLPNRRTVPDRLTVSVQLNKGGPQNVTHCYRGHEFTPENTYTMPSTGYRSCVTCRRTRQEQRKRRAAA